MKHVQLALWAQVMLVIALLAIPVNRHADIQQIVYQPLEQRLVAKIEPTQEEIVAQYKAQIKPNRDFVMNLQKLDAKLYCLAVNNYYEAGGESFLGKVAVSEVVRNRVKSKRYPGDACSVVHQSMDVATTTQDDEGQDVVTTTKVCQFSWYCEDRLGVPLLNENGKINPNVYRVWYDSVVAAMVAQKNVNLVHGATHFFLFKQVKPEWSHRFVKLEVIGNHQFMKPRGA